MSKKGEVFLKRFRKVLVVLLAILVPVSIGFGFNFFSKNMEATSNKKHQTMTVDGTLEINEEKIASVNNLVPGDKICDGVTIDVKSTAVSLLRVKVDVYYGEVGGEINKSASDICSINGIDETKWTKGSDGYYYYMDGVTTGKQLDFASSIYFQVVNENIDINDYQGKEIKVVAKAELVQAKHGVFAEKWGLTSDMKNQTDKDIYTKLLAVSDTQSK